MMIGKAILQAALLTLTLLPLVALASADFIDSSLDLDASSSLLEHDGGSGRYFPTISNTSLVITYTTAIVAALMLGSFLWVAASFGQGGEAGGYGNYRKKRQASMQDSGQKVTLASDVWNRQEEEAGRPEEQLWEAWRKKEEEEEGRQLREAFQQKGMEDENCQLLVACLSAMKQSNKALVASQLDKIISSISSKRKKRLISPHDNSVEGDFTDRIIEAHRKGGESEDCGKLYKGNNCHSTRELMGKVAREEK